MSQKNRSQESVNPEVEAMLAELEGRDVQAEPESAFRPTLQAQAFRKAQRWPAGFTARGAKEAPLPRWPARFIASGVKPAR